MQKINKTIYMVLTACVMYVLMVITNYDITCLQDVFQGVEFDGRPVYYAITLMLFAIPLFYGFGETDKYVTGYGILEITRTGKKDIVIRNIIVKQLLRTVEVAAAEIIIYMAAVHIALDGKGSMCNGSSLMAVMLLVLVSFSLMMWQSIFEIIWDGRIAAVAVLAVVLVHMYVGDTINYYGYNKYLHIIGYGGFAITARSEKIGINPYIMIGIMIVICVVQIIILRSVFKKKDIFSTKQ